MATGPVKDANTGEGARPVYILASDGTIATSGSDATAANQTSANTKLDTIISLLGTSTSTQTWKSANYTTSQTGASIWTPGSGKKIAITHLTIGTYGTTAARMILWIGASADMTYTAGTDQLVFAGSFAPATTSYPGVVLVPPTPILAANADYILRITTDANLSVDIAVYGYEY